jgi:putative holliday junction resolvase
LTYNTSIKKRFGDSSKIIHYRLLKVQQKETFNGLEIPRTGRIIGLDPGTTHVGLAVSDELQLIATPIAALSRKSWKKLLTDVEAAIASYDALALVIGLPLNSNGSESQMSLEAREMARKFNLSLKIPVFLQDERVTSYEARKRLWDRGVDPADTKKFVDSESAAIILTDFLDGLRQRR